MRWRAYLSLSLLDDARERQWLPESIHCSGSATRVMMHAAGVATAEERGDLTYRRSPSMVDFLGLEGGCSRCLLVSLLR